MTQPNELGVSEVDFSLHNRNLEQDLHATEMPDPVKEQLLALRKDYPIDIIHVYDTQNVYNRRPTVAKNMVPLLIEKAEKIRAALSLSDDEPLPDDSNPMYNTDPKKGTTFSALSEWHGRAKGTGMAIFALDRAAEAYDLGASRIPLNAFFDPCIEHEGEKLSAFDYVTATQGLEMAEFKRDEHIAFIVTRIDHNSRYILSASEDSIAIRVRKVLAGQVALRAMADHDKDTPIRMASLGAGSALPVVEAIKELTQAGYTVEAAHLFDMDAMALAVANSVMQSEGVDPSIIKLHAQRIAFKGEPLQSIEPESVHYVEAWGLAEYFKDHRAANLGRTAMQLLMPGGTYCYGNMLRDRGQKELFDLVNWQPPVRMRDPAEATNVLVDAGYINVGISVPRISQVYLGYHGQRPDKPNAKQKPSRPNLKIIE